MRRLLALTTITVLCVVSTACSSSGGGGSADSSPGGPIVSTDASGGSAGRTASDSGSTDSSTGQLAGRLLTVKDLPSDWHQVGSVRTSAPSTDSSGNKSNCLDAFGADSVKPEQQARVDFAKGSAGVPIANLAVGQYGDSKAKPAFDRISAAFSACHEATNTDSSGAVTNVTLKKFDISQRGDDTLAFEVSSKKGTQTYFSDLGLVRKGDRMTLVSISDREAPDRKLFESLLDKAAKKL